MGLTARLLQSAARTPDVLVVPVPGRSDVRRAVEDALDARGWRRAASPAQATLLLVCGVAGPELLGAVDVAWDGLPGPRARRELTHVHQVEQALDDAVRELADEPAQRRDAQERRVPALSAAGDTGGMEHDMGDMGDMGGMEHGMGDHDMGGTEHDTGDMGGAEHDMGDMGDMGGAEHDMGGMGGMEHDMGGMEHDMAGMSLPGGLRMAGRVEDRDGLRLEGLELSLGPVLPGWPAGLVLDVVLSGDVLRKVEVRHLDGQREEPTSPLDALAALLDAAGWQDGAMRARLARAEGADGPRTRDLLRRLCKARLLRWSLRGLPGPGGRDLAGHLDLLVQAVQDGAELPAAADEELAAALTGLELGTARAVVAAFAPTLSAVAARV